MKLQTTHHQMVISEYVCGCALVTPTGYGLQRPQEQTRCFPSRRRCWRRARLGPVLRLELGDANEKKIHMSRTIGRNARECKSARLEITAAALTCLKPAFQMVIVHFILRHSNATISNTLKAHSFHAAAMTEESAA